MGRLVIAIVMTISLVIWFVHNTLDSQNDEVKGMVNTEVKK